MFVILATAWNILGGYAGYVNFGTPAFFGLGVYTAAVLYKAFATPLLVQIAAAAVMGGLLGLAAGMLTLRLRGIFFAIATIALVVIMETLIINWRYAGGATGLQLLRPPPTAPFESYIKMLFVLMVGWPSEPGVRATASESGIRAAERRPRQRGGRRGERGRRSGQVSHARVGRARGAGARPCRWTSPCRPGVHLNLNYAIGALASPMIGGMVHWIGPVIGALILSSLQQIVTVTISGEMNVLVVGVLLIVFVVAAPDGILGFFKKWLKRS